MIQSPAEHGSGRCPIRRRTLSANSSCPPTALAGASLCLALLHAFAGCMPAASPVPLGLGPLAIAEQDAADRAEAQRSQKSARSARALDAEAAAARPVAKAALPIREKEPKPSADDEKADDSAATSAPALEGMYAGADIAVFRLTGLPDREQRDDKAKIRIDKASGGNVSITLINSEDGSDLCELTARVDGHAALIESAQPCFSDGSEGSLEAELTSGRAVVEGDRLVMNAEGTLSVALPDQELDGEMTYSFKGERQ